MNKKIAVFSVHSDPLALLGSRECGGQNLYIRSLVQNLDKMGWTVDVFTRLSDRNKNTVSKIGKRSRVVRLVGGPVSSVPKGKLHPYFPELYRNFLDFSANESYDLFHGHHYDGGWMALKAQEQFKKPMVITFHSLGKIRFETQKKFLGKSSEDDIYKERFAMEEEQTAKSSAIIELAESEKKHLEEFYNATPEKVYVIPGGVNVAEFKPLPKDKAREAVGLSKEDYVILFVGRLEWRKGVATLIHGFKLVKEKNPNAKLVIVGGKIHGRTFNADDKKEVERLIKVAEMHGVANDMRFVGAVNRGDLPKYFSSSDVLVIPSYYEPFGLVAIEGLASKIPVVASRTGGLQVTIKDGVNGLLFEPRNPSDLAKKILSLIASPALVQTCIENGYKDVIEKYSWKKIAQEICGVYQKLIEAHEIYEGTKKIEDRAVSAV